MSQCLSPFNHINPANFFENSRLRSNSSYSSYSSSSSTELINKESFQQQIKSANTKSKPIHPIVLPKLWNSKLNQDSSLSFLPQPFQKKIQDEQMDNLNLFLDIISQIHQQQSSDQLKKEESAIIERKRELRKLKIQRYREKKQSRRWDVLRYEVRKNIAKSRLRIKGRFVRE